ncbi:AI-2E family transporter [Niabella drilacis]|uniref:Predicted PurR-regulated permease PerM n=1 Tax=Niabella drilacis (strain DSM 25811 / CCM 8410 / CCUG 62505 / LMG 26954 / E90) TaxID=1285928 RepID=A0A1G6N0I6_NIADE|nr:AI-2E family transporter [Niabella drilacis]SDC60984.1 Predicted PurR-regulated permease PerM [Niabella drilacis]
MSYRKIDNNILRQIVLILLIGLLGFMIFFNLRYFTPGALGAITLYILFRKTFFRLTEQQKWRKSLASFFLMFTTLVIIALPLWLIIEVMIPRISSLLANRQVIIEKFNAVKTFIASKPVLNRINLSDESLLRALGKVTAYFPGILNSVAEIFVNIFTALFILYFMQVNARGMEKRIRLFIPFSDDNTQTLWEETKMMVRSNALGIPILALCQGLVAILGYWIFGVDNFVMWGLITGAASMVPAVGTMLVWVPICVVVFATGSVGNGIGLTLYCLLVVGGIDNVLRFTILKKIGDIHPLITVFGVLLGLKLFGIMGLIFGPLFMSYFLLLIQVYRIEFGRKSDLVVPDTGATDEVRKK